MKNKYLRDRMSRPSPYFTVFNANTGEHTIDYAAVKAKPVSQERLLVCKIIERAAVDYLNGCLEAECFFFGKEYEYCEALFELTELNYNSFTEKLLEKKNTIVKKGITNGKLH